MQGLEAEGPGWLREDSVWGAGREGLGAACNDAEGCALRFSSLSVYSATKAMSVFMSLPVELVPSPSNESFRRSKSVRPRWLFEGIRPALRTCVSSDEGGGGDGDEGGWLLEPAPDGSLACGGRFDLRRRLRFGFGFSVGSDLVSDSVAEFGSGGGGRLGARGTGESGIS